MSPQAAFFEREYNARLAIPDHPQIFARWAEQAAATRKLRACLIDLAYGDTGAQRLDLFPARADGAPLFVFIHGGYWRSLDKSDFSWVVPPFVAHGVAVALINYGLAPHTPIEDMVRQTLKALAWLYRNGDRLGFDPARIVVGGHSAGAHLAAMALAARFDILDPALPRELVKGGLVISGLFELEPLVHAPFVNVDLKLDLARARKLSPALLPPATAAPLVTAVGALESGEFQRQTRLIAQRWTSIGVRNVAMPGVNHLTVCDELADAAGPLFDATLQLVRQGRRSG
jgi:arylformamidase